MHGKIKFTVLGGLGEIGMNCLAIESDREMILIDCGLLFSDLETFGVEYIIPNLSLIMDRKDKIKAIFATHGHEDHIGAIPYAARLGLQVPVYGTPFTCALVRDRLKEFGMLNRMPVNEIHYRGRVEFSDFQIEFVPVNHSIVEASALFIKTPAGMVIHTGDFKMDPQPFFGHPMDLNLFKKAGDEGVLLLMSDSTNVEVKEETTSENRIYHKFEEIFVKAQGLVVVSTFASNIGRVGQVVDLAKKMEKRIVVSGRSMESNVQAAKQLGYLDGIDQCLINPEDIDDYPRKDIIVLSTGSQGEFRSSLTRIAMGEHRHVALQKGDLVVMSSKFIPGNEIAISRVINQLFREGADVLYESIHDVHVSGHASEPELEKMLRAVRPKYFVPIHGEYRHLVHHGALARKVGLPEDKVLIASNGDVFELEEQRIQPVGQLENTRIMVEGEQYVELQKDLLKDRRKLAEKGLAIVMLTRRLETGKIVAGPEVIFKGAIPSDAESDFKLVAVKAIKKLVKDYLDERDGVPSNRVFSENIRLTIQRLVRNKFGRKPNVIPVVIDL